MYAPWVRGRGGDHVQHVRQGREGLPCVSVQHPEAPADDVRRLPLHDARENLAVTRHKGASRLFRKSVLSAVIRRTGGF